MMCTQAEAEHTELGLSWRTPSCLLGAGHMDLLSFFPFSSLSLSPRGSYFILCIWNGLSLRRVMVKIPAETSLPWEALSDQPGATPPFLLSLLSSCV